jgi:hypothetical protein
MKAMLNFFNMKGTVHFEFRPHSQSTKLMVWKYWSGYMKLCVETGLNFGPMI